MVVFKWEWNAKRPGHDGVIDTGVLDIIRQEEEGEKKKRSSYYFNR